jgi:hypothetical protein
MMTEFEGQVLADLSVLKSQMTSLLGIGQPGRINLIEEQIQLHERSIQRVKGLAGAMSIVFTLVNLAIDYCRR